MLGIPADRPRIDGWLISIDFLGVPSFAILNFDSAERRIHILFFEVAVHW